ncbi:MAG: chemotaxis protein CheX [Deltaproteobacteria bacterium]|nr:chemotaxis protein CheX [Deltaproteobacteria bacterium]
MKREDIQEAVEEVVLDVFENMYFMFPEVIAEDDPAPSFPESCFKAGVAVKNTSLVLMLYGSKQLVTDMAKNFLGTAQAIADTDLLDVFKEAANVIAGNLITRLALDAGIGHDVPVAERLDDCSELRATQGARQVIFNVDDEFFKVAVVS